MRIPQFPGAQLAPTGIRGRWERLFGNLGMLRGVPALPSLPLLTSPRLREHVPEEFLGLNIAAGTTPAHDEYTLAKIRELGIRRVRLDYPEPENSLHRRLLDRLLEDDLEVLLHLVQAPRKASQMTAPEKIREWVDFVRVIAARPNNSLQVELGSAPNRFAFSGYTLRTLVSTVAAAAPILRQAGISWSAPGLSDFEPLFLEAFLSLLGSRGLTPSAVTCNLHLDRAGGPEHRDPRVLGNLLSQVFPWDLGRKITALSRITRRHGVPGLQCGFFSWTVLGEQDRHRRYVDEEQQANYIARYLLLAGTTCGLERVFAGPLVSPSRGLIDSPPRRRNFPPVVVLSPPLAGDPATYRERPAFSVVRWLAEFLSDATLKSRLPTPRGVHAFHFRRNREQDWLVFWTAERLQIELEPRLFTPQPDRLQAFDRGGRPLAGLPRQLGEAPVFVLLPAGSQAPDADGWRPAQRESIVIPARPHERRFGSVEQDGLRGILAEDLGGILGYSRAGKLSFGEEFLVRRTRHSRLFRLPLPEPRLIVQIKEFPPGRFPFGSHSKAFAVWRKLLAAQGRNLRVAEPLGYLESAGEPQRRPSYLLTRFLPEAVSLRHRIQEGATASRDLVELYQRAGRTIRNWHQAGVSHGDLSIGNLLAIPGQEELLIVDLDRACFRHRMPRWRRLRDLARVRVPAAAEAGFLQGYFDRPGVRDRAGLVLARLLYREKLAIRRFLRRLAG